jgi:hypothetical protein
MKTVLFMRLTLSECDHLIKLAHTNIQPSSGGFLLPTFNPTASPYRGFAGVLFNALKPTEGVTYEIRNLGRQWGGNDFFL